MLARITVLLGLSVVALVGCGSLDNREWMKTEGRYTKEEFQRDHRECSRKGDLDEPCMRQRGWVPVTPTKEEAPKGVDPLKGGRGRY